VRATGVEIDLGAIRANARTLRERAGKPLMAVVKANAYGHGALPAAKAALAGGAEWLGVATVAEGLTLRRGGVTAPILVLGFTDPSEARRAARAGMRLALAHPRWAERYGRNAPGLLVHLKVDSGMGRFGARPEEIRPLVEACRAAGLVIEGAFTHFAAAEADEAFTRQQADVFRAVVAELRRMGEPLPVVHAENSAAILRQATPWTTLARAGIALYGLAPDGTGEVPLGLIPALRWWARIAHLKVVGSGETVGYGRTFRAERPTRVATLPFGYGDGYPRALSNRAEVLVGGRRCPVVGRVSMDQVTVAVPDDVPAELGQRVTVVGAEGSERITLEELARLAGTINYELAAGIAARMPRRYRGAGGEGDA
jgi:alanine racemase